MWAKITTFRQVRMLPRGTRILFNPDGETTLPINNLANGNDYEVKEHRDDMLILSQSWETEGRNFYSQRSLSLKEAVNGKWWAWE